MRTVVEYGPRCLAEPGDYAARSELMWCGSLSHCGLTGLGRDNGFPVHRLGHELAARYDIPHGMSLTILWPHWARAARRVLAPRLARLARTVFGAAEPEEDAASLACIHAVSAWFEGLGLPVSFAQAPMGREKDQVLAQFAARCTSGGTAPLGGLCPLDYGQVLAVYRAANGG